jgi:hypothetical protein
VLRELTVGASLEPRTIDVAWQFAQAGTSRPAFRLTRRLGGYPVVDTDGVQVIDVDDLFPLAPPAPSAPWARLVRTELWTANGPADDPNMFQGRIDLYYATVASVQPARVTIGWFNAALGHNEGVVIDEVSRVVRTVQPLVAPFTFVVSLEIFATPGGGAEVSEGVITLFDFVPDPTTPPPAPAQLRWAPAVGPVVNVGYQLLRATTYAGDGVSARFTVDDTTAAFFVPVSASSALGTISIDAAHDPTADVTEWTVQFSDGGLTPGLTYYYRLFTGAPFVMGAVPAMGSALATADLGAHDLMYGLLPPVHRIADAELAAPGQRGQLDRFLSPFGAALDHVNGLIDALPARHDIARARVDELPHLSRMIGWSPDLVAPAPTQRQDLEFAAELFAAVGTLRNPPAVVNRVTGWLCDVKEFAHNVVLTNAPETQHLWEIWQVTRTAGTWSTPAPLTLTTFADSDPIALDVGGTSWVIWHSDRSGRRELWFQRLGVDAAPVRVMSGAPDDAVGHTYSDEAPTAVVNGANVLLFWSSDRTGTPQIWSREMTPVPGPATLISNLASTGHNPAAVRIGTSLWLFWDSAQRGTTDIWSRVLTAGVWSAESRMVKDGALDELNDSRPAALVAPTGDLWLFWCRDRGDRREIWHQLNSGGVWGAQISLSTDLTTGQRDEAPGPVVDGTHVILFFHSNRGSNWQIWSRVHDGVAWRNAVRMSGELTADKEATAFMDGAGKLQVLWSSQRRAPWYRSRTLDFDDVHMLAEMGTFNDHTHYTYDTGLGPDDWYARGTVGLYLTPDTHDTTKIAAGIERAAAFLEPFRPAPVRFTWPLRDMVHEEPIEVGDLLGETWSDGA